MRRTVLSTFFFAAILGLGCMGVAVPVKADAARFEGQWMGTGTVVRKDPYFPSAFSGSEGSRPLAEICGDFRTNFEVRGKKFQGRLHMTGDVPSEYSVKGEISDDGSLENVSIERVDNQSAYGAKFEYLGTLSRGRWEYEAESTYENWGCGGTYVAQSSK